MIKAMVYIADGHEAEQKTYPPLTIYIGAKNEDTTASGLLWTYGTTIQHDLIEDNYKHVATVTLQRVDE